MYMHVLFILFIIYVPIRRRRPLCDEIVKIRKLT